MIHRFRSVNFELGLVETRESCSSSSSSSRPKSSCHWTVITAACSCLRQECNLKLFLVVTSWAGDGVSSCPCKNMRHYLNNVSSCLLLNQLFCSSQPLWGWLFGDLHLSPEPYEAGNDHPGLSCFLSFHEHWTLCCMSEVSQNFSSVCQFWELIFWGKERWIEWNTL